MIATNIVAVADVSAKDHHPIGALAKGATPALARPGLNT